MIVGTLYIIYIGIRKKINLSSISKKLMFENIEYFPDQFLGLIYKNRTPDTTLIIFESGKIICTGARVLPDVSRAVKILKSELADGGFL